MRCWLVLVQAWECRHQDGHERNQHGLDINHFVLQHTRTCQRLYTNIRLAAKYEHLGTCCQGQASSFQAEKNEESTVMSSRLVQWQL